jgi:hypothetical protein
MFKFIEERKIYNIHFLKRENVKYTFGLDEGHCIVELKVGENLEGEPMHL